MRRLLALGAIALAGSFAVPSAALANDCGAIVVGGETGAVYVAVDSDGSGVWIYEESNGQPGLQRGGNTLTGDPDTCQSDGTPDTAIF